MIGVHIKKNKSMSLKTLDSYLEPKKVFFTFKEEDMIYVKEKETVEEGQIIGRKKKFDMPIIASISGTIHINKKTSKIEIKNNFKKKEYTDDIPYEYTYTKTEFLNILKESGIVGMGGAGFPTYLKYDTKNKIKTLIINGVECEPYITADYVLASNYAKEIIKTLNWIMKTLSIPECFIAIKVKNPILKEKLFTIADKYKKIKIVEVPNLYPMGWERSLVRYIKHIDYEKFPIEQGIVVNNISTIYAIGEALKHKKPLIERIVTFTGDGMNHPCNVKVKIGTSIEEVLNYLHGLNDDSNKIIGGPMMGVASDLKEIEITSTTNCVLALKKEELNEQVCLRCGKCAQNCPAKLTPVLIRENKKEKDTLKYLHPEKCIECGICSFICPARINLREEVKEAKETIKGGKV